MTVINVANDNGLTNFIGDDYPPILSIQRQEHNAIVQLSINSDLKWFNGHFDHQPVLPGVVQVHWAGLLLQALFEISLTFHQADNIKFQNIIVPPADITLSLQYDSSQSRGRFSYSSVKGDHSKGSLLFQ
jgi:3-hydroxymyristoyl/3-hydroxydecanoyl-(acyl carrier protein) dehydratase